jgi:Protein of unknown function (DUF2637)
MTSTAVPSAPTGAAAVAADTWLRRFRALLVGVLGLAVGGIGALAFWTSFEAIKAYAEVSGGIAIEHAWAVPLLVDSFIVVATGADLWFTTTKHTRRLWELWWPKALLAGAAGVSFVLNVAHVQANNWAARGVAAIPPAALVLGVELLMLVLRRATALRTERLAAGLAEAQAETAALAATLERHTPAERNTPALPPVKRNNARRGRRNAKGGTSGAEPPSRYAQAVAWVHAERAAGRSPTGTQVAAEFHISSGLGRRAIRDADGSGPAEPAHQPQAAEALRLVGDRSTPDTEPAPALPAAQGGEA